MRTAAKRLRVACEEEGDNDGAKPQRNESGDRKPGSPESLRAVEVPEGHADQWLDISPGARCEEE